MLINMLKQLFGFHMDEPKTDGKVPLRPTVLLVPEEGKDGTVNIVSKVLEPLVSGPLVGMSYSDFSIHSLIAAGCDIKDIQLAKDGRIGMDADIDAINERLIESAEKLFISKTDD